VTKSVSVNTAQEQGATFEFLTGGVTLTSTPSGARVVIADKTVGITPYHLADQPPGDIRYALQATGYTRFEGQVTVPPGQEIQAPPAILTKPEKVATAAPVHKSTAPRGSSSSGGHSSGSSHNSNERDNGETTGQRWMRILAPGGIIR
jgi:hypothetical protein